MTGYKNTGTDPVTAPEALAREAVSALWDHELSELEQRRQAAGLQLDSEKRATLARYALIGEALRQPEDETLVGPGFLAGLNQRLDTEGVQIRPPQPSLPATASVTRLLAGSAIAASVALLVVAGVRYQSAGQEPQPLLAVTEPAAIESRAAEPSAMALAVRAREAKLTPAMERKLNRYLAGHGEYARDQGVGQMLPYVSLVSYGDKP